MSFSDSDSDYELDDSVRIGECFDDIGHVPPNSNNCSEDEGIRDVQSDDDLEMASCSSYPEDGPVLISIGELKLLVFLDLS
ncbi:unnamed protein product [Haemonchus placei]|uniref:RNA-directed DNA polymerase, eukaryota, reverse transcriptase zinc-binding domain protein n=1 Tax=Haemonchus placei TaxID=6290 RepID=A0A0N4WDT9_HAEPC|nr:unnamed protein product [Haemonchus placei]